MTILPQTIALESHPRSPRNPRESAITGFGITHLIKLPEVPGVFVTNSSLVAIIGS
jgi:hypothetical protein